MGFLVSGIFVSVRNERTGTGVTVRDSVQRIAWLGGLRDDGMALVMPLSDRMLPSGIIREVPEEAFLEEFMPDQAIYEEHLREVVDSLRVRLQLATELPGDLYPEERIFMDGLAALLHGRSGAKAVHADIPLLLETLAHFGDGRPSGAFQTRLSGVAVDYRRRGDYPRALLFYDRALTMTGQEDRLLFNLARVHYEMGDVAEAESCLTRALEHNPTLEEARRFLAFLAERTLPAQNGEE